MKKITFLILIASFLGYAQQPSNGTFDSDVTGWVNQNGATITHESGDGQPKGSLKIQTDGTTTSGAKATSFSVDNSGNYIVKFDVKGTNGTKIQAQTWQSGVGTNVSNTYTISGTDWQEISLKISGVINTTNVSLRLIGKTTATTYYVDNVVFAEATNENMYVTNPDFESGLTGWTQTGTTESSLGLVAGNGSTNAGALTFTADQTAITYFDNAVYDFGKEVAPGELTISFDAKTTNANAEYQGIFKLYDENGANLGSLSTGLETIPADGSWHSVSFNKFNTIGGFHRIQVRIKIKQGALNTDVVAVDNITSEFYYVPLSVANDANELLQTTIYPNPVENRLSISTEVALVEIYSILGQRIASYANKSSIDTSNLQAGTYVIKLISKQGNTATRKFVKK